LEEARARPADVFVDFTSPESVKQRTLDALSRCVRVVVGTSGLTAADFRDIERQATQCGLGVVAAGNFSLTAALAKHLALLAAKHLPSWEVIDYAHAEKPDAPSGTARELAEPLGSPRVRRTTGTPAPGCFGTEEATQRASPADGAWMRSPQSSAVEGEVCMATGIHGGPGRRAE
jgi:4-hydroxy-tetrahydrodipicolinate reductase